MRPTSLIFKLQRLSITEHRYAYFTFSSELWRVGTRQWEAFRRKFSVSEDWLPTLSNTQKEQQTKAGVMPEVGFSPFRSIHLPIHPSSRAYFLTHSTEHTEMTQPLLCRSGVHGVAPSFKWCPHENEPVVLWGGVFVITRKTQWKWYWFYCIILLTRTPDLIVGISIKIIKFLQIIFCCYSTE